MWYLRRRDATEWWFAIKRCRSDPLPQASVPPPVCGWVLFSFCLEYICTFNKGCINPLLYPRPCMGAHPRSPDEMETQPMDIDILSQVDMFLVWNNQTDVVNRMQFHMSKDAFRVKRHPWWRWPCHCYPDRRIRSWDHWSKVYFDWITG